MLWWCLFNGFDGTLDGLCPAVGGCLTMFDHRRLFGVVFNSGLKCLCSLNGLVPWVPGSAIPAGDIVRRPAGVSRCFCFEIKLTKPRIPIFMAVARLEELELSSFDALCKCADETHQTIYCFCIPWSCSHQWWRQGFLEDPLAHQVMQTMRHKGKWDLRDEKFVHKYGSNHYSFSGRSRWVQWWFRRFSHNFSKIPSSWGPKRALTKHAQSMEPSESMEAQL